MVLFDPKLVLSMSFLRSLGILACSLVVVGCNHIQLVSMSSEGVLGNGESSYASVSADGRYVVFMSSASNLVPDDTNNETDVFLRDTKNNTTSLVSMSTSGGSGNGISGYPSISADGRYVVFQSSSTDLIPLGTQNPFTLNVFLRDMQTGETSLINLTQAGEQPDRGFSGFPAISRDGRFVVFHSSSEGLVAEPHGIVGGMHVYLRDLQSGVTERITKDYDGGIGLRNSGGAQAVVSANGRYVAFHSDSMDLVEGDTNLETDVFLRDTHTNITTRLSVDSDGNEGNGPSTSPSITDDGRFVTFTSRANNLVSGDTNFVADVFLHDTQTGTTTRVSIDNSGNQIQGSSSPARTSSISGDGRYVAFDTPWNLVDGELLGYYDIYVRDLLAGKTKRISLDEKGARANGSSSWPVLSPDGRYVVFQSAANNLVPVDRDTFINDIFLRFVPQPVITSVLPTHLPIGAVTSVTITGEDFLEGAIPTIEGGVTSNIVRVNETTITVDVEVPATRASGARNVIVSLLGSGPGAIGGGAALCQGCITFH